MYLFAINLFITLFIAQKCVYKINKKLLEQHRTITIVQLKFITIYRTQFKTTNNNDNKLPALLLYFIRTLTL